MLLTWIIVFSVLGSAGAIAGAAWLLLFQQGTRTTLLPCLLSYATGTLLGAAFLGMIPKALQQNTALVISATILAGIVIFFILEKMIIWRHCHSACAQRSLTPSKFGKAANAECAEPATKSTLPSRSAS